MGEIEFRNVSKCFEDTNVIKELNLTIRDGDFTVLLGASGCGKTTLLRMIAGIGPATSGQIFMDGVDITNVPPEKRDIAMVFQNYAIYPTMKVQENIEFGLKNRKVPKEERKKLVAEYAEIVGLTPYLKRKPSQLSGGQRQRIALARAMVKKPKVFLMDEPLSNLDAKLRASMRVELIELHNRLQTTFVYVTHDQIEAMSMADTIVLMNEGKIQQIGSPEEVYHNPNNVFVAQFIGTPPMNIIELSGGKKMGFRPEKVILSSEDIINCALRLHGIIITREMLGSQTQYKVKLDDERIVMVKIPEDSFAEKQSVWLNVEQKNLYYFGADGNRIRTEEGRNA